MIGQIRAEVLKWANEQARSLMPMGLPFSTIVGYMCDVFDRELGHLLRHVEKLEREVLDD